MSYSRHLTKGLRILGEHRYAKARAWIAAGENAFDKALRAVFIGVPGYVLWRLVSSSWKVLALVVLVVVWKALRTATKAAKEQQAELAPARPPATEAPAADAEEDDLPPVTEQQFLSLLHDLLGVARGVHLRTLAAALTTRYGGAWEVADVRRLCTAAGVTVTPTVRAPGGKPTVGVYRDGVPPLPDPSPVPAVVGPEVVVVAGQESTTPATTPVPTTATTSRTERVVGGLRIVAQDDPANPARTHVVVLDPRRKRTG